MKLSKLIGSIIGGISAIAGLGVLATGCNEDTNVDPKNQKSDAETCCGDTLGLSQSAYSYCMNEYA